MLNMTNVNTVGRFQDTEKEKLKCIASKFANFEILHKEV